MDPVAVPTFQFDDWAIFPLHAVKGDVKAIPIVYGSLLQTPTKRGIENATNITLSIQKRQQCSNWKKVLFHGSRENIFISFQVEYKTITSKLKKIVLGAVFTYRNGLLGGKRGKARDYDNETFLDLNFGMHFTAINFCALLLSFFTANGVLGSTAKLVNDQHI